LACALELAHAGYEVHVEPDGPVALRAGAEWEPDLVVLDVGLPTLDGLDVCRRLRAASWAPILILTARDAIEDRARGLDAGADDYVTKPFSLDELLARAVDPAASRLATATARTIRPRAAVAGRRAAFGAGRRARAASARPAVARRRPADPRSAAGGEPGPRLRVHQRRGS